MKDLLQSIAICAADMTDFHITTQFFPVFCLRKFALSKGISDPRKIWHRFRSETFIFYHRNVCCADTRYATWFSPRDLRCI